LWPSFDPQAPNQARRQNAGADAAINQAAQEGAAAAADNRNRFDMTQMVNRLREFLAQMELNLPNQNNDINDNQDQDNFNDDEFD
jgi:hypothetical protein